jgi:predicted component of type VI protein secretion system
MPAVTNRERIHTYLVLKMGGTERIIVWDSQDVTVGRAAENDISIDDAALSRRHAEFYRSSGAWAVKDLGTSNGTTVNGDTIRERVLQNKDVVRFGEIEISFVQSPKNPAQIGKKVEFASQLKGFGGAAGKAKDGEATMLGLVQTLDDDSSEDDFVVGKINDFGSELAEMPSPGRGPVPRDLDLELDAPGGDPPPLPVQKGSTIPPAHRLPTAAKPGVRLAPPGAPNSLLDDLEESRPAARPQPRPAARAATPMPAPAVAAPARRGTLSLQLEIEGLSSELRGALEALLGKVIELPALRIRVKADDL